MKISNDELFFAEPGLKSRTDLFAICVDIASYFKFRVKICANRAERGDDETHSTYIQSEVRTAKLNIQGLNAHDLHLHQALNSKIATGIQGPFVFGIIYKDFMHQ